MAVCANCGAELTGDYCTQCGESSGGASQTRQRSSKPVRKWGLIALGILVALVVLAAIILPSIFTFSGSGEAGSLDAELDYVQTAMIAMMFDRKLTTVDDHTTGPAVNTWNAFPGPGAVPLNKYLREKTTQYYYCWDAKGKVWQRNDPGKYPTRKTAKNAGKCSSLPKVALPTKPPRK